jgi:hypothetical protein
VVKEGSVEEALEETLEEAQQLQDKLVLSGVEEEVTVRTVRFNTGAGLREEVGRGQMTGELAG